MEKCCKNCKRWNGTSASTLGDCQHVIFTLLPMDYEDRFDDKCTAPFDPHSLRYYLSTSGIHEALNNINAEYRSEDVLWMEDNGVEVVKRKKLPYLQTHKDYTCERYRAL